jgi:hypothetical protein
MKGYLLRGKGGQCVGLTTLSPSCADCVDTLGGSKSCSPNGLSRSVMEYFVYLFIYHLQNGLFHRGFPHKIVYGFLLSLRETEYLSTAISEASHFRRIFIVAKSAY